MTFFKESQQRIASFSLEKSLTKRRLCEAYEKPQWKGLLKKERTRPMEGRVLACTQYRYWHLCVHIILNGMVIFMINNYLKEVVKLPKHQESNDDCKTLFGECSLEFHGLCDFEDKLQVAPCIGCPYHR